MTQQEQQDFQDNLDTALFWMQAVQDRLKTIDNTQGPRSNLEARLRETEKILESEHEGRVKMDMVLVGAEILLQKGDEELNCHIHTKLKDLKGLWEETTTYVIHCHSRIEWVWLHWSEYLKAFQEFELWMARQQCSLDTELELQVGATEKLWQVDHQRVVVSDVSSQAVFLQRLLEESATLHNRTQDPSVGPHAQKKLQEAYNDVRDRAQERLVLLQKIAEEHQMYHSCILKFKLWLQLKIDKLNDLVESKTTAEDQLKALQILKDSVAIEEKSLQHIESMVDAMRVNTSPAGTELLIKETDDLRLGWQNLLQRLSVSGEGFRSNLDSCSLYSTRCQCLAESISHLRTLFQKLKQDLEENETSGMGESTEDLMVDRWRKYMGVRNALSVQEPQVEHLKDQLKELFRFSHHDSQHLSDEVLTVVKEHQSMKVCALKLCSDAENGLRQVLQEPFHSFSQWSQLVCQVLDDSADVSDSSHIDMQVQRIEKLIKQGAALEERLRLLQAKRDLLDSLFGSEKTESLFSELRTAIANRELLHSQLVQRKSIMQGLIARIKDFDAAYESTCTKLMVLKKQLITADCLQPDILAKKTQCDQFMVIMKDLEDCEVSIVAMETLGQFSSNNRTKFDRLYKDWKLLYKTVKVKISESETSITEHQSFQENLLTVEKWLMTMRQRLESYCSPSGEWSIENRQHEAERALGEFPEKELQLHRTETQGNAVLERTSKDGMAHILGDMKRLRESWISLHDLSLCLYRLLTNHDSSEHLNSDPREGGRNQSSENLSLAHNISIGEAESPDRDSMQHRERHPKGYSGESHVALASGNHEGLSARKLIRGADEGLIVSMEKRTILGHGVGARDFEELDNSLEGCSELARKDTQKCGNSLSITADINNKLGSEVKEHPFAVVEVDSSKWGQSQNETGQTVPSSMGGTVCSTSSTIFQSSTVVGLSAVDIGQTEKCVEKQAKDAAEHTAVTTDIHNSQGSGVSFREKDVEMDDRGGRKRGALTTVQQTRQGLTLQHGLLAGSPIQSSSQKTLGPSQVLSAKDNESRRQEFEVWLCRQNKLLSEIPLTKRKLAAKDFKFRQNTFKTLKAGVAWGQEQFELLIQESRCPRSSSGRHLEEDVNLEELRYRWMLYKSKLKDTEDIKAQLDHRERRCDVRQRPAEDTLHQKKHPSLLYRVCSLALPFQLLFLLLLLFAFLLPFMDGVASCSLSNNFARSFNIMLRYNGPPPT